MSLPRPISNCPHSKTLVIQAAGAELGGAGRLAGAEMSPKNFLKKRLTLGQTGCILGVEKDERARNGRLESMNMIRGIVNTMYIGHCCSL